MWEFETVTCARELELTTTKLRFSTSQPVAGRVRRKSIALLGLGGFQQTAGGASGHLLAILACGKLSDVRAELHSHVLHEGKLLHHVADQELSREIEEPARQWPASPVVHGANFAMSHWLQRQEIKCHVAAALTEIRKHRSSKCFVCCFVLRPWFNCSACSCKWGEIRRFSDIITPFTLWLTTLVGSKNGLI